MGNAVDDFKAFILKGDVVSMAVGIVIGLAFQAVITALVADIITPLIGVAGHFDFSAWTFTLNGSKFLQGAFMNAVISFLLVSLVVFFLVVRPYEQLKNRRKKPEAPAVVTTRDCPYCFSSISNKARRCPNCTSEVAPTFQEGLPAKA
jgi:large conductance mechanosensitive channel